MHFLSLQVMCYTNIGAELEHLRRWDDCLEAYQIAYQLSFMAMGQVHPLTVRCKDSFVEVYKRTEARVEEQRRKEAKKVAVNPADTLHDLTLLQRNASFRTAQRAAQRTLKPTLDPETLSTYSKPVTHDLSVCP